MQRTPGAGTSLTPFIDLGTVRNRGEASTGLSSLGLAVRWQWQGLRLDVALAHRLRRLAALSHGGSSLQDHGVHLQLAWKF